MVSKSKSEDTKMAITNALGRRVIFFCQSDSLFEFADYFKCIVYIGPTDSVKFKVMSK